MKTTFKFIIALAALLFIAPALSFGQEAETYMGTSLTPSGEDNYLLTLESYLKGKTVEVQTITHTATDFALVLDMSSSMLSEFTSAGSSLSGLDKELGVLPALYYDYPEANYDDAGGRAYQYQVGSSGDDEDWVDIVYNRNNNGKWQYYNRNGWRDAPATGNFRVRNFFPMQKAVANFVKAVAADAVYDADGKDGPDNVNHRISISIFNADVNYGGTGNYAGYGNTTTLLELTSVLGTGESTLLTQISNLSKTSDGNHSIYMGRGTHSNLGMALGYDILSKSKAENKVAVLFTDGKPTSPMVDRDDDDPRIDNGRGGQNISGSIVNGCIAESYKIKHDLGGKVFVIALGANGYTGATLNYMQYTSSNYPDATSYSNPGTKDSEDYFGAATNADALNALFIQIGKEATGGASAEVTSENSYTKGVLSQSFVIPEDVDADDILVYTCTAASVNASGIPTWKTSGTEPDGIIVYRDADGLVYTESGTGRTAEFWVPFTAPAEIENPVVIDGNTLTVKGFDFSEHWVGPTVEGDTHLMQKLIIMVPVQTAEDAVGGPDVAVLDKDNSGLYLYGAEGEDDVPVDNYTDVKAGVPVNIKIQISGLEQGESVIIKISQSNTGEEDSYTTPFTSLILTGDAEGKASAAIKTGIVKYFKLEVNKAWSWTYDTENKGSSTTTYGVEVNPFIFESAKDSGITILNAENAVRNDFKAGTHSQAREVAKSGTTDDNEEIGEDEGGM